MGSLAQWPRHGPVGAGGGVVSSTSDTIRLPSIGTLGPVARTPAGEVKIAGKGSRSMDIYLSPAKATELYEALGVVLGISGAEA